MMTHTCHLPGVSVATDVDDSEALCGCESSFTPTPVPQTQAQLKPVPTLHKLSARPSAHLPLLPMFIAAEGDDGDAFIIGQKKTELPCRGQWTTCETLMQLELHLTGKAELRHTN